MAAASDGLAGARRALVPLLALCAAACGAVNAGPHAVQGQVTLGPMCGGPMREGPACDIAYAEVDVQLFDARGQLLGRTRTDAQGAFSLQSTQSPVTLRVVSPRVVRCPERVLQLPLPLAPPLIVACDSGRR